MKRTKVYCPNNFEWRKERAKSIGASAIGILAGENKYSTPIQLRDKMLAEMRGEFDFTQTRAQKRGHAYESGVAAMWCEETGISLIKASEGEFVVRREDIPFLHCSPDRVYWVDPEGKRSEDNKGVLECKTTLSWEPIKEVPITWQFQLQVQMGICGYKEGYIAWDCLACPSDDGFGYMRYDFDPELFEAAVALCQDFWVRCIINGEDPELTGRADVSYAHPHPAAAETIAPDDVIELLREYYELVESEKIVKDRIEQIKDAVAVAIGANDTLVDRFGHKLATYKETAGRTSIDSKKLKADYPDVYYEVSTKGESSRSLRINQPKKSEI